MKKILLTTLSAVFFNTAFAQAPMPFKINKTCYRGAFAPAPTPMWTDNWTSWDPQNKVYPAPTVTVTSNITANTTWSVGQTILITTPIYVKNNSVLTIQPGVVIRGQKNTTASLIITKGSQLIANGTPTAPIVFTTDQAVGLRGVGDWGGVILLGKAINNNSGGIGNIEGLPISADTEHGGTNDNDNSGSMQFVRIEYCGVVYQPNQEINGLTLGSVGRSTILDNIQVSYCNDDAFEWFAGTVNAKHLVSYRNVDDDFDTDNGFSGSVQFCLAVRDPQLADNPAVSTSEFFESDNNASGTAATPLTSGIFSNATCIGALRGAPTSTVASGHRDRVRIRRNSALRIYNSIFTDQPTRGLFIDGLASETNALNGTLKFKNNILAGYAQRATESGTFGIIGSNTFVIANANDTLKLSSGILTTPYNYLTPDYRPSAGSIALAGVSFTDAILTPVTASVNTTINATVPSSFCIGEFTLISQPAIFVASTSISPEFCSLSWSVSPGVTISNTSIANPSFTISTVGTFSVYLNVNFPEGGVSSIMKTITTTTCTNVSINDYKNKIGSVALYPNPTADNTTLIIDNYNVESLNVLVYDITGKLVMSPIQNQSLLVGKNKFTINTSDLNNGIYFVTLITNKGKETVKLIVNK